MIYTFSELKNIVKNFASSFNPMKSQLDKSVSDFKRAMQSSQGISHEDPIKVRDSLMARRPKSDPSKEHEGWNKLRVENFKNRNPFVDGVSLQNENSFTTKGLIPVDFAWIIDYK